MFTLIGIAAERKRLARAKRHEQASQVSAWVARESDGKAWIAVLNQSKNPIYEVVLSIVSFNVPDTSSGKYTPHEYRDFLSVVPPDKHYACVENDYHGMGFHPAVEIAFKDIEGNYWLRKGNGSISEISTSPVEHYRLSLPVEWQLPEQQMP